MENIPDHIRTQSLFLSEGKNAPFSGKQRHPAGWRETMQTRDCARADFLFRNAF
ncbi:hypothetical protein AmDm5_0385 [Acetobacter malorum]|nr:hypothetical protein AmDm5_0385 [Acetobacter malorum]